MVRGLVVASAAAVAAGGCATQPSHPRTQLTVVALNQWVGRSVFHLACSPAGGDFPSVTTACRWLERKPELVTRPKPFVCAGGLSSWWDITVSGRLAGRPLRHRFSTCWTPQMETIGRFGLSWAVLKRHLVPRRRESVLPGTSRVFAPGVLRPTDLVTCDILAHVLQIGVPIERDQPSSVGYGGAHVVSVTLQVTRRTDGSVATTCRRGPV